MTTEEYEVDFEDLGDVEDDDLDSFEFKSYEHDPFAAYSDPPAAEPAEEDQPNIAQLREQWSQEARKAKEAETAHAALQRQVAFMKAGVNLDSALGKLLLKGYDGDLSDIEALKADLRDYGVDQKANDS
jgi:hypothetical protein